MLRRLVPVAAVAALLAAAAACSSFSADTGDAPDAGGDAANPGPDASSSGADAAAESGGGCASLFCASFDDPVNYESEWDGLDQDPANATEITFARITDSPHTAPAAVRFTLAPEAHYQSNAFVKRFSSLTKAAFKLRFMLRPVQPSMGSPDTTVQVGGITLKGSIGTLYVYAALRGRTVYARTERTENGDGPTIDDVGASTDLLVDQWASIELDVSLANGKVTAALRADGKLAGTTELATGTAPPVDVTASIGAVCASAESTNGTVFDVDTVSLAAE
jgi:hypothetical protein